MDSLEKIKEAYQDAKNKLGDNKELSDIVVNTKTGDFTFIWSTEGPDKE